MKYRILLIAVAVAVSVAGVAWVSGAVSAAEVRPAQVLRHVVMFKFKDGTSAEDIRKIEQAFCALPDKVGTVADFEWGTDVSPEGLADGLTHCFFMTFNSEADRAAYLPHPAHKAFGEMLGPVLDKVVVLDYWTKP